MFVVQVACWHGVVPPLGPPSVASRTYLSPASALPEPVVKYSNAAWSAALVGVPPEGAMASLVRMAGSVVVPGPTGTTTAVSPGGTSQHWAPHGSGSGVTRLLGKSS